MTFEEMQLIMQSVVISQREMQSVLSETQLLTQSVARGVQAMQDKALSDELRYEEEKIRHEQRMEKLEQMNEGLINLLDAIDSDRPTILRKLNTIEQKTDSILSRLPANN
jgi:hypothetical protein